jgi:hypothetical protein
MITAAAITTTGSRVTCDLLMPTSYDLLGTVVAED